MKMVSKLALAAVFSLGAVGMGATPAAAQKEKKDKNKKEEVDPNAASPTRISAEYRKPAGDAEAAIAKKDWATADTKLTAAEALAKNDDEKYFAAAMRLQVEANKPNNLENIVKVLDLLINNPRTPKASLPLYNFLRGDSTFKIKARRAEAIPFLIKARDMGYVPQGAPSDISIMLAQSYFDANNLTAGAAEMEKAIASEKAAGKKPDENWYNVVFVRFYNAHDRANTALWATRWLKDYPTAENWRRLIVNYRNSQNNGVQLSKGQKLDMFRLMRATRALADENDYLDYANSAQQSGLPWEAVTVINEAKAAGKIAAGASQFTVILTASQTQVKSEGSLDALVKPAQAAATGKLAAESGDAFLASDNYARAVELYDVALQKGSVDTDAVNLHRGVALFKLGRKDEARTAFGLVKAAPLSDIAGFWVTWIDLPTPPAG